MSIAINCKMIHEEMQEFMLRLNFKYERDLSKCFPWHSGDILKHTQVHDGIWGWEKREENGKYPIQANENIFIKNEIFPFPRI